MGWMGLAAAALLISGAADGSDDRPAKPAIVRPAPAPPIAVNTVEKTSEIDDPVVAARHLELALLDRLKPLEARLRQDTHLRHAGTVIGIGAVMLGALRRERPFAAAGTGVLRFGLDRQLTTIQRRTGFSVAPRVERRGVSIFVTKTFR